MNDNLDTFFKWFCTRHDSQAHNREKVRQQHDEREHTTLLLTFPHCVSLELESPEDFFRVVGIMEDMVQRMGDKGWNSGWTHNGSGRFYFVHHRDAVWFKLTYQ